MTITNNEIILTDYERGWTEAIIDGEGYIGIQKTPRPDRFSTTYCGVISIANTKLCLLQKAQSIFGGVINPKHNYINDKASDYWVLTLKPTLCKKLLGQITLTSKEHQRKILLELGELGRERGCNGRSNELTLKMEGLYNRMKLANKKGRGN